MELADRNLSVQEGIYALHILILHANEFGQPKGQELSLAADPRLFFIRFQGILLKRKDMKKNEIITSINKYRRNISFVKCYNHQRSVYYSITCNWIKAKKYCKFINFYMLMSLGRS
jgi:hypothetical protein